MTAFHLNSCLTATGKVVMYTPRPMRWSDRPVAVFLHGALRSAGALADWADILGECADVVLVDLPGHGRSDPLIPATVQGLAESVHHALRHVLTGRQALLVGESLGGLISLAIGGHADPGPIRAVFAADPPITAAKLWNVASAFRGAMSLHPDDTLLASLGWEVFGITPGDAVERIYYPLIGALRVPTVIATGDIPLLPPRQIDATPCLFDAVDCFVTEHLYPGKVQIIRIPNSGHLLLTHATDACLAPIVTLLAEHCIAQPPADRPAKT
jgi:pimeloyl-ACP methyl ester carboxylesterase